MTNYQITSKGRNYINNPPRNQNDQIRTNYFKDLILIYIVEKGLYKPYEFKEYIQSLGILNNKDWELMTTKNYPIWKHHIDAAKQGLSQILAKNPDGTFSISDKEFDDTYSKISDYIEIMEQPMPEFLEKEEYSHEKVTATITRAVCDTALSNKAKKTNNMEHEKDTILRKFLNRWSLENVKTMTISEYNQLSNQDTFCYWVEHKTKKIANISGASNSFKFEIFERKDKNKIYNTADFKTDELYSWRKRAGNTRDEAFNKTKDNIIRVINSALAGNFEDIDSKEIKLSPLFRWKIAFLYSNKKILAISDKTAVKWLAKQYGMPNYKNARLSSVHSFLMQQIDKNNYWEEEMLMWNWYKKFKKNGQSITIESEKTQIRKETEQKNIQEYFRTIYIRKEILLTKEHNKIQNSLYEKLVSNLGKKAVKMEKNFIDIRVEHDDKVKFFEIKCDISATRCIRMALGQIIEYAFNDDTTKKKEIVVFGNHKPKKEEVEYISHLQNMLPDLKFSYLYSLEQI